MRLVVGLAVTAALAMSPLLAAAQGGAEVAPGQMPAAPRAMETRPEIDLSARLGLLAGGGRFQGAELEAALRKAAAFPLGSRENPVRVSMPQGQHAYLRRLRCSDDKPPRFERVGNFGPGVFGSIIDGYRVICPDEGEPRESLIYMDMYHPDHVETAAPAGFTLKMRARQP